jgi:hypothetical protein
MGGIVGGIVKNLDSDTLGHLTLEAKVERLTKLVHILWKEAERLESIVKVIPEGLQIKTGMSEVTVLRNGGVIITGQRILVEAPGRQELYL